jgi:hypothetical protein
MLAADKGKMTGEAYARAVIGLAVRKHDHISLTPATLLEIAKSDDTKALERFKVVVTFIGGPTADLDSHAVVTWGFLNELWRSSLPELSKGAASGAILERFVPLLVRHGQFDSVYRGMMTDHTAPWRLRDYLAGWARGHFLNIV